jgi:DNA-binding transcriptional regulator YiaG
MASQPEHGGVKTALDSVLSSEVLARIDVALNSRNRSDSDAHRLLEQSQQKWEGILRPQIEAIRSSEQLTQDDFAIRINMRD